jgi:hypothetical protein
MPDINKCDMCEKYLDELQDEFGENAGETKFKKMITRCLDGEWKDVLICGDCIKCNMCGKAAKNDCYTLCFCFDVTHCEDCEMYYDRLDWCEVCKNHLYNDNLCRHVYHAIDFDIQGAGIWWDNNRYLQDYLKPCFFQMLDFMGYRFALDLRYTIEKGLFGKEGWTYLTTVSSYGDRDTYGTNEYRHRQKWGCFESYVEKIIKNTDDYDNDIYLEDVYDWLVSLSPLPGSKKANELTISWINEWLKTPLARTELLKLAARETINNIRGAFNKWPLSECG